MTEKNQDVTPEQDLEDQDAESGVQKQLAEAKAKSIEYYDQLLRLRAEFDNFRKRIEREKMEARAWGKQEVLLELISLVDVFEQAKEQAAHAKEMNQMVAGVELLHKKFMQFLKAEGLEPIDLTGKPFDPLKAEVLAQEEVDEDRAGIVLEEFQKGYMLGGRVLRPSRVRVGVSKRSSPKADEEDNEPGTA